MPVAARLHLGAAAHGSVRPRSSRLFTRQPRSGRLPSGAQLVQAAKTADGPAVAIVGVTGAVGQEFLKASTQLKCVSTLTQALKTYKSLATYTSTALLQLYTLTCSQHLQLFFNMHVADYDLCYM